MKKYQIPRNKRVEKLKVQKIDAYHKGYITTWNGYIKVKAPKDHPYKDRKGYIMEHRLVIERQIGKYLEPEQEVHHLDGDKTNNKIENLLVVSKTEHRRIHLQNSIHKPRYSLN